MLALYKNSLEVTQAALLVSELISFPTTVIIMQCRQSQLFHAVVIEPSKALQPTAFLREVGQKEECLINLNNVLLLLQHVNLIKVTLKVSYTIAEHRLLKYI